MFGKFKKRALILDAQMLLVFLFFTKEISTVWPPYHCNQRGCEVTIKFKNHKDDWGLVETTLLYLGVRSYLAWTVLLTGIAIRRRFTDKVWVGLVRNHLIGPSFIVSTLTGASNHIWNKYFQLFQHDDALFQKR